MAKERCATRLRSATRSALATRSDLPERGRSTRRNSRIARGYSSVMEACDRCFFPNGRSARTTLSHRRAHCTHARMHRAESQCFGNHLKRSHRPIRWGMGVRSSPIQTSHRRTLHAYAIAELVLQCGVMRRSGRKCAAFPRTAVTRCVPAGTPDVYPLALPMCTRWHSR